MPALFAGQKSNMEPQVTQFNGAVYVMVPDHIEDIVVLRKKDSFKFNLPQDTRRIGEGRAYRDEGIIEPRRP